MQNLLGPHQSLFNIFSQHIFQTNLICGSKPRRTAIALRRGGRGCYRLAHWPGEAGGPQLCYRVPNSEPVPSALDLAHSSQLPRQEMRLHLFPDLQMRPLWLRDFSKRLRTQEDKVAGPLQLLSSYLRHWSAFPMTTGTSEKTVILKSRGKIKTKQNKTKKRFF